MKEIKNVCAKVNISKISNILKEIFTSEYMKEIIPISEISTIPKQVIYEWDMQEKLCLSYAKIMKEIGAGEN